MITNLIVMDNNHMYNGEPMEDADIYQNRLVCHPLFKEPLRKHLCTIDKTYQPIFITIEEWNTMGIFSSLINKESNNVAKEAHKVMYQEWWNKILNRAMKEHNGYLCSIQKS